MMESSTHKQILKSTGIVGGSQIVIILLGIVRTKIIAVLLGPIGIGLIGLYQSLIDILRNATGLGINFSAVRDVAISNSTGDTLKISRTITVLRLWAFVTGLFGMMFSVLFCNLLSKITFGNADHSYEIALLSIVIFIMAVSGGQLAILQGLRELAKMSKANIFGAIIGFLISIPIYWYYGVGGIVPALVFTSISTLALSWYYSQKIKIVDVVINKTEAFKEGLGMAKLGFFTVVTALVGALILYVVRIFVQRKLGLDGVGYFQAAWSLSTVYLAIVLNAMGADFYPILSAINSDNYKVNQLINDQTEIALLIASPIIIGMLAFLPLIINIMYSARFGGAVNILQWQILGTFFRVLSFPLGYLLLAKGKGILYVITDLLFNIPFLIFVILGWPYFGLQITGISYLISYLICFFCVLCFSMKLSKFAFTKMNVKLILVFGALCLISFLNAYYCNTWVKYLFSFFLVILGLILSLTKLNKIVNVKSLLLRFYK